MSDELILRTRSSKRTAPSDREPTGPSLGRERGTCREWRETFGFITADSGKSIFAHYSAVQVPGFKRLTPGARYAFDVVNTPKGLQATEIVPEALDV
jgi:CspA family cold shock protein